MQNAGLNVAQTGIKISGRNINNLVIQMIPHSRQKAKNSRAFWWICGGESGLPVLFLCHLSNLSFLDVGFEASFFTLLFQLHQEVFSSSLLSSIRVVSSGYLRLMIFLPEILIPVCASSSLAFSMMYSAYKLKEQGDSIQLWFTPFPIWNQSVVPCPVLLLLDLHTGFSGGR